METVQQAETARLALNGQVLLGKRLVVRPANQDSNNSGTTAMTTLSNMASSLQSGGKPQQQQPQTASKLQSQQRSLEEKIAAIKRKLQQTK